jgi:hypothetical protein
MGINIDENIATIQKTIAEFKEELLRLEGSLRVLVNMKQCGVNYIDIKTEDLVETKEIVGCSGSILTSESMNS